MGWSRYAEGYRHMAMNSGLFYLRAGPRTLDLMRRIARRVTTEHVWDQTAYNQEMFRLSNGDYVSPQVAVRVMDIDLFMNSKRLFKFVRHLPQDQQKLPVMVGLLLCCCCCCCLRGLSVGETLVMTTAGLCVLDSGQDACASVLKTARAPLSHHNQPLSLSLLTSLTTTGAHQLPPGKDGAADGGVPVLYRGRQGGAQPLGRRLRPRPVDLDSCVCQNLLPDPDTSHGHTRPLRLDARWKVYTP